jgi:hypothetical protein
MVKVWNDVRERIGVEMNFHADTKSLLKQADPQRDLSRFAKHISRMIHHPARVILSTNTKSASRKRMAAQGHIRRR